MHRDSIPDFASASNTPKQVPDLFGGNYLYFEANWLLFGGRTFSPTAAATATRLAFTLAFIT